MGAIVHCERFHRPAMRRIGSEEEALEVAAQVAESLEGADWRGALAALSRSGLLAIATPAAHGGADVTNVTLSGVVSAFAARAPLVARALVSHFTALEMLRNASGPAQSIFSRVEAGARLSARFGAGEAETPQGEALTVTLRKQPDGAALARITLPPDETDGDPLHGASFEVPEDALPLVQAVRRLLEAGLFLGENRRGPAGLDEPFSPSLAMKRMAAYETVSALVERAAAALDLAQVSPSSANRTEAARLAEVLDYVRQTVSTRA